MQCTLDIWFKSHLQILLNRVCLRIRNEQEKNHKIHKLNVRSSSMAADETTAAKSAVATSIQSILDVDEAALMGDISMFNLCNICT